MSETFENSLVFSDNELKLATSLDQSGKRLKTPIWYDEKPRSQSSLRKKFIMILIITLLFGLLQMLMSIFSGSLSLLNDSLHQLIDTASVVVCLLALRYSKKRANERFTYGYHRLEIIGAICCNLILLFLMLMLVQESLGRIFSMRSPDYEKRVVSTLMIVGACLGIFCDLLLMFLLKSRKDIMDFYKEHDKCCH